MKVTMSRKSKLGSKGNLKVTDDGFYKVSKLQGAGFTCEYTSKNTYEVASTHTSMKNAKLNKFRFRAGIDIVNV